MHIRAHLMNIVRRRLSTPSIVNEILFSFADQPMANANSSGASPDALISFSHESYFFL